MKTLFIIDCFIHSKTVENKLIDCVKRLYSDNKDILLISNSIIDDDILKYVNYFFYDKENRLFSNKMKHEEVTIWRYSNDIHIYDCLPNLHKHGLSVLRNLFKSLKLAKEYGYTHFHRIEVDDIMGSNSYQNMNKIPDYINNNSLDGLFIRNDDEIFFHYMFSSIDFILNNIYEINDEDQYFDYIINMMKLQKLVSVEKFFNHNLLLNNKNIKVLDITIINSLFPDTKWNTEISTSNIDKKYNGCTTKLYKVYKDGVEQDYYSVLSFNYKDSKVVRDIKIYSDDNVYKKTHTIDDKNSWVSSFVDKKTKRIEVYENGKVLYTENSNDLKSYIIIK